MRRTMRGFFSQCLPSVSVLGVLWLGMLSTSRASDSPTWEFLGPEGAGVPTVVIDPSNPSVLYAGTYSKSVFKSEDGGRHWKAIKTDLEDVFVSCIAIDPLTPSTLYIGTRAPVEFTAELTEGRGIFKSTDGGQTWMESNTGVTNLHIYSIAVDPAAPSTIYAGTYGNGLFKSIDTGITWTPVATDVSFISLLVIDPTEPSTVYLGSERGLFKSIDGGDSWTVLIGDMHVYSLAVDPVQSSILYAGSSEGRIFKSTDNGTTWTPLNTGVSGDVTAVVGLAIDPSDPMILYAAVKSRGIFKSTDAGATWTEKNTGLSVTPNTSFLSLAMDAANPSTIYAGTLTGVLKSLDGGETWTLYKAGFPGQRISKLVVHPEDPAILYAAGLGPGLIRSSDGGKSWENSFLGLPNTDIKAIAIDPQQPSTLYTIAYLKGVFKSIDAGRTWEPTKSQPPAFLHSLVIAPIHSQIVYAGSIRGGVWKSIDGGDTWAMLYPDGYPSTWSNWNIVLHPEDPSILYRDHDGDIWKSTDGGETWSAPRVGTHLCAPQEPDILALAIDPRDPSVLYAGTTPLTPSDPKVYCPGAVGGVFKSTDGGETWTRAGLRRMSITAFAFVPTDSGSIVYAGTGGDGLFKSIDGGATWTTVSTESASPSISVLGVVMTTPPMLYMGTRDGVFRTVLEDHVTWVEENEQHPDIPKRYLLSQNRPNPFNPSTTILFSVPGTNLQPDVRLVVYNVLGQPVRTLVHGPMESGVHEAVWDGRDDQGMRVSSGIYLYRVSVRGTTKTRKMLLID